MLGELESGAEVTVNYKGRLGFASSQDEAVEESCIPGLADAEYQGNQDVWGRRVKGIKEDSRWTTVGHGRCGMGFR